MNDKEKKRYGLPTLLIVLLVGVLVGLLILPSKKQTNSTSLTKLDEAMALIESYYVENQDRDTLTEKMISAMLSKLDPHSRYLSVEELRKEQENIQGGFEGIGVLLFYQGDTACVDNLIPGGPAEKAGLMPGDRLLAVDTTRIAGVNMSKDKIVNTIRGPHHSIADITLLRYGESKVRHIRVKRDLISTPSIVYSGMIDNETGYIRLTRFCETSHDEFRIAVKQLKAEGMKSLILDLRSNGGGLLQAALGIADELLPGRETIVYTQGDHQRKDISRSTRGGLWCDGKLAVLIDEYSASASEIIAGTVQDNDRGLIIGRRSFGKGLVQRQFSLSDGSAIWLTTARYYTPSGRCIQRPYDRGTDEYYSEFLEQLSLEALSDSLLTKINDSTPYHTTKGRIVYGGGGIYPDHHLKMFTDSLLVYYNRLLDKQCVAQVAFDYVARNYAQLKKQYATEDQFVKEFATSDELMNACVRLGEKRGVKPHPQTLAKYGDEIRLSIKAQIGQSLFRSETLYRILLLKDNDLTSALRIVKSH